MGGATKSGVQNFRKRFVSKAATDSA